MKLKGINPNIKLHFWKLFLYLKKLIISCRKCVVGSTLLSNAIDGGICGYERCENVNMVIFIWYNYVWLLRCMSKTGKKVELWLNIMIGEKYVWGHYK